MILNIKHQEKYSRGQLLLRTFLGFIYILIPHGFVLFFISLASFILTFLAFWAVLFTGRYPKSFFIFNEQFYRWQLRVNARILHLADGYPEFGMNAKDERVTLTIPYPEKLSRLHLLLRVFFATIYLLIPHGIILFFRYIITNVLIFVAWWVVLFTGKYPDSLHDFNVGTIRWQTRVMVYLSFMTDKYPPFNGKPDAVQGTE